MKFNKIEVKVLSILSLIFSNVGCGQFSEGTTSSDSVSEEKILLHLESPCLENQIDSRLTRCGHVDGVQATYFNFNGQDFQGVLVERSNFYRSRFMRVQMDFAVVRLSNFSESNFKNLIGRAMLFDRVYLARSNFEFADLRGSRFESVNLMRTNLKGADLRSVVFDSQTRLTWAVYDQTTCLPFSEEEARLRGLVKENSAGLEPRDCSSGVQVELSNE